MPPLQVVAADCQLSPEARSPSVVTPPGGVSAGYPATLAGLCALKPSSPQLVARLAVHRLDLVIADEPLRRTMSIKAFNHSLGSTPMSFYAAPGPLLSSARRAGFPACLDGAPMLLPGAASPNRGRLEAWLSRHGLRPLVVAEFDDGALMKAFGREGRGIFAAPSVLDADTVGQYGVRPLGTTEEIVEEFFAISAERRITHPCVAAITATARGLLVA